jgi:hypothetical protein
MAFKRPLSSERKCCQQIIGLDDKSSSVAVRIDAKEKSVLPEYLLNIAQG